MSFLLMGKSMESSFPEYAAFLSMIFNRNEAKMFAGLVMNRYTEQFNTIESLSNITYIYGETDMAVGRLTVEEVAFLQLKNANILSGNGGHDVPFEGFLKQGFREAFGIVLQ